MELTTYRHCAITADDDLISIDDGMVIVDQSQASIFAWDPDKGRFTQVDRFTGVEVKPSRDGTVNLVGTSEHLLRVVQVPPADAKFAIQITPGGGCKDCS